MDNIKISVTLLDVIPATQRVLLVPETLTLDRLHLVIQAAMGWMNCHLHCFETADRRWGATDVGFAMDGDEPEAETSLAQFIAASEGSQLLYGYDFGDDWWHLIEVLDRLPGLGRKPKLELLEVEGTCPPEDIGGSPGYEQFLEVMADPNHEEHADIKEWHGGGFDPQRPDTRGLTRAVANLARKWKLAGSKNSR